MIIRLVPYIYLDGVAEEAMSFYKEILELRNPQIMRFKESLPNLAGTPFGEKIMHGSLEHDKFELFFSDTQEGTTTPVGSRLSLTLDFDSEEEIRRVYDSLKDGGEVKMELQATFWDALYAAVVDKYGIHWDLNCQIPKG